MDSEFQVSNFTILTKTHSREETHALGKKIGDLITTPMIIALSGDLGSGKTAFVQGLAKGLEVPDQYYITSPTFTLINEYPGRLHLFHVDLYRLEGLVDAEQIGIYDILQGEGVVAIEWAEKLPESAFEDYLAITFEIIADESRQLHFFASGQQPVNLIHALGKV